MWKKENKTSPQTPARQPARPASPSPSPSQQTKSQPPSPSTSAADAARIGPKVVVKGDIYGEEDLVIEGQVEGTVTLENHGVVVAPSGKLTANVFADNIRVAGNVQGNLTAAHKVVLLETAHLEGNVSAKTVTIETGAHFRGSVDMEGSRAAGETKKEEKKSSLSPSVETKTVETKPRNPASPVGAAN